MRAGRFFLLLLAAAAVASALALRGLTFDHTTRSLMRADAEADESENELIDVFGAEDILLVAWEVEDLFSPGEFARIASVTRALEEIEGLEEVFSIANVEFGIGGGLRRLAEKDFEHPDAVREALLAAPVYLRTFYNERLDVVAVASSLKPGNRAATLEAVRRVARDHGGLIVSGVTPFAVEASEYAIADLKRIGLLALAVAVAVLLVLCRSLRETLIAVLATGLPPLFALGVAAALGLPLTALGAALFPVLAVVGITSSVHLLNAYAETGSAGAAARRIAAPVLLSLATTAVAFWSLHATGVPAFRAAGAIVAIGLLFAMPVVLLGIPAALQLTAPTRRERRARPLDRVLLGLALAARRRGAVIVGAGVLLAAAGLLLVPASRLQVQVLQAFQPDSDIAKTYRFLEQRLTATVPVDLILKADEGSDDGEVLEDLRRFSRAADGIEGVDSTLGLDDLVDYGRSVSPVDPGEAGALIYLRLRMGRITKRFEDFAGRRYRVKVRVKEGTGPEVLDRLAALADRCRSGSARLTGLFVRAVGTTRHLVSDLARGALLMLAVVLATVGLALRSWRLGLAALLPNLLPPLVVFGAAAALGVPLDVSAVAVGAVSIGLAIDDSLHLLFRAVKERRAGRSRESALLRTQRSVGRALVLSTVVLAAGLCCLAFSRFLPTARFGLFTAAASAVALLADLLLLPALIRRWKCL